MGPWSGLITGWCGALAPVEPLKGQILRMRYDGPAFNVALNYRGNYVDSKADGLVWGRLDRGERRLQRYAEFERAATASSAIWR